MLNTAKNRRRPTRFVEMISPHGTLVEVAEDRAESLINRGAVQFGDGKFRKWSYAEDSDDGKPLEVDASESAATPSAMKERVAVKRGSSKDAKES